MEIKSEAEKVRIDLERLKSFGWFNEKEHKLLLQKIKTLENKLKRLVGDGVGRKD